MGSHNYDDLKQFTVSIEEKLFRMDALRDRSLTYKTEEIQVPRTRGSRIAYEAFGSSC